jgi:DNA polymerase-3 subunit alpha
MLTTGGVVTGLSARYTKRGERMATFTLEDLDAVLEVMVFPKTMTEYGGLLEEDAVVVVRGRLDTREEQPKLIAMEITRHDLVPATSAVPVEVTLPIHRLTDSMVRQLKELVSDHPGPCPVHLRVGEKVLRLPPQFNVESHGGIIGALKELFGTGAVLS